MAAVLGKYQGCKCGCNFGPGASSGQLTSKTGGERPAHSLHVNIVILANLTSLSTSVREFLVLSFIMVYHAPLPALITSSTRSSAL
jgi:hypothetical protein